MEEAHGQVAINTSSLPIETISGVKFTPREIDVLACILGGRTAKKIASFLSVSSKTVENHIYHIMLKLECNSRTSISDFLESSDEVVFLRNHYADLSFQVTFERKLKEVSSQSLRETPLCSLIYWPGEQKYTFLLPQLEKHLKFAGVKVTIEARKDSCTVDVLIKEAENSSKGFRLLGIPQDLKDPLSASKVFSKLEISQLFAEEQKPLSFLLSGGQQKLLINFSEVFPYQREGQKSYYLSLVEILKSLFSEHNFEDLLSTIQKHYEGNNKGLVQNQLSPSPSPQKTTIKNRVAQIFKSRKGQLSLLSLIAMVSVFYYGFGSIFQIKNVGTQKESLIRSDLFIPHDDVLLGRPEIMAEIDEKLKGQNSIHTVVLIGAGGAGKTTMARHYAHQKHANVVWEINAETKGNLVASFENLAQSLAKTEEDQKLLRGHHEIKDSVERKEKILHFVKERLKLQQPWFLIYDNVENFADVQKYFPRDTNTWGEGKIILTTRNANIHNNSHINQVIHVGELSKDQKLSLFMQILNHGENGKAKIVPKKELIEFLEKIPPFPLDVSVAAYYLKTTNVPYGKYLEHLNQQDKEFTAVQESLLKEAGEYTKTRYSIITLSLKQLMDTHKDFGELLLFIGLLDSQNIPKNLLNHHKNNAVVDNFIYNLKKYSLITAEPSAFATESTLSLHRSTQAIILAYLTQALTLKKNTNFIQSIANTLENYIEDILEKNELLKAKELINHLKVFLAHTSLLTKSVSSFISGELGIIYYDLCFYVKAKDYLEVGIKIAGEDGDNENAKAARFFLYLGNSYKSLGDYEKAKTLLEKSYILYNSMKTKDPMGMSKMLAYLGNFYRDIGDYEKAEAFLEQSVAVDESKDSINRGRTFSYLGNLYRDTGHYEKAKDFYKKSLDVIHKSLSKDHPRTARVLAHLGDIYRELGNYQEAKSSLEEALSIYKKHLTKDHVNNGWILVELANVYRDSGEYKDAEAIIQKALSIYKENHSEDHADVLFALSQLGILQGDLGNNKEAKDLLEKCFLGYKKQFSEDSPKTARVLVYLGNIYKNLGEYEKAMHLLEKALTIYQTHSPEHYLVKAWVLTSLGAVHLELSNYEEAKTVLEKSLKIYKENLQENHLKTAWTSLNLGRAYVSLSNFQQGQEFLEKSLKSYEEHYKKNHVEIAHALRALGELYFLNNDLETAEKYFLRSLAILTLNKYPDIFMVLEDLAELNLKKSIQALSKNDSIQSQNFKTQALDYLRQALKIVKTNFPEDSPHIKRIQDKIKGLEEIKFLSSGRVLSLGTAEEYLKNRYLCFRGD